jgi:hypothetical protein
VIEDDHGPLAEALFEQVSDGAAMKLSVAKVLSGTDSWLVNVIGP